MFAIINFITISRVCFLTAFGLFIMLIVGISFLLAAWERREKSRRQRLRARASWVSHAARAGKPTTATADLH
jgi:hypothetical protein